MPSSGDDDGFETCLGCGAQVSSVVNRLFPVGCDDVICMECALRRGGEYDEERDQWKVAPQVDDLLEAVESHAH